jgi:putative ABC transport system permease protein
MLWVKRFRFAARALWGAGTIRREIDEELGFHIEMRRLENLRSGLSADAAERDARRRFGDLRQIRETCYAIHRAEKEGARGFMSNLWQDLRYGVRTLRKSPGLVAAAVLSLALGIGANTTLFSVIDAVLLRPLPYPEPERLVMLWQTQPAQSRFKELPSPPNLLDWLERNEAFEALAGWMNSSMILRSEQESEHIQVARVTGGFFAVAGIEPVLGRSFFPQEVAQGVYDQAAISRGGGERAAVISHGLWKRRFGGDPAAVGQILRLDDGNARIVGVLPAGFEFPDRDMALWMPVDFRNHKGRDQHFLPAAGRLRAGWTLEQAQAEMDRLAAELAEQYPEANQGWGIRLMPMHEELVEGVRPGFLVLFGAVVLVLLIACANVASLLLARAVARQQEVAVRVALGASRSRLIRQFLTESLLLAGAGAALGVVLASWALAALTGLNPSDIPRIGQVHLDGRVLAFTLGMTALTGIVFGLAPALQGSKPDPGGALAEGGLRGSTAGPRGQRTRRLLVIGEVALALILLVGAGLLLRSFVRLNVVDPGFDAKNALVLRISLDRGRYGARDGSGPHPRDYFRGLMERIEALPSVKSAGGVSALPMNPVNVDFDRPYWREGETPPPGGPNQADVRLATPHYFDAMGMRLLRGRSFTAQDGPESPLVVVVNQSLARRVWPGQEAVGRRLVVDYIRGARTYEVVGVVNDLHFYDLRREPRPEMYFPHAQISYLGLNVVVRTNEDPASLAPVLERVVRELDPLQPVHSVATLEELLAESLARDRFLMSLLGSLAAVALLLAATGIYGVMAYLVSQRTHEIGVRMALGAQRKDAFAMVLRQSLMLSASGAAIGLLAAYGLSRGIAGLLFGISPTDPATFAGVAGLLGAVAVLAGWMPARRAASIDPMDALRHG